MRRTLLALLVLVLAAPGARAAERRVALVIGVSAYQHVPALANTRNDADAITGALRRLGFDVDLVADPDRAALEGAVRRFGERARGADAAVFYYAGHALELGGRNWLVPTSANPRTERDMRFEALDLDTVLEQADGGARVTLIFLDSCRDNPFKLQLAGARGLSRGGLGETPAAVGTLVVFSTAPGSVAQDGAGPNSPFTAAMLRHIEEPGVDVRQVVAEVRRDVREATGGRQVPWENSALEGQFFFRTEARAPVSRPPVAGAEPNGGAPAGESVEALFWQSIRASRDPEDFHAYLARFPDGVFAQLARNRLAGFGGPPKAARDANVAPAEPPRAGAAPDAAAPDAAAVTGALQRALAARASGLDAAARAKRTGDYLALGEHKALLGLPGGNGTWQTGTWNTAERAREAGLEKCQAFFGQPCGVIAIDGAALPTNGPLQVSDMPRVRYAGMFDPLQVPGSNVEIREGKAARDYAGAASPKAAAYHPWGKLFLVVDAATARQAQERALAACTDDPVRHGRDGPCYLYAVGNQVVLPQRRTAPVP